KGKGIPVKFSAAAIQDDHGRRTGVVLVINDISEQKRSAAETANTLTRLRGAMNSIIEAMAFTVETRDPYTAGHQRRVTDLARAIAGELGLSDDEIDGIRMAGVIHDLGKISIPAEILSKPGRLSPIEFELIKTHPRTGYEILKNIDFPWPVAQIVFQHHEKMDGSGYPLGASGSDILIESRVLAVADVVEAIASHRPYRAALGIEKSLEEIVKFRGIHFDPAVVDACVILFTERGFQF
nr:HD domain-containing protein [Spirochaetota bacterium]